MTDDEVTKVTEDLRGVFGLTEGPVATGSVSITPSTISREQVLHLAKTCPLDPIIRDLGAVVARELANELSAANLRPADYAEFAELGPIVRDRVIKVLLKNPNDFLGSVAQHLRMRG